MDVELELRALRTLEAKVRRMFDFTGWCEGVDDDAAQAVNDVETALTDIDGARRLFRLSQGKDGERG